MQKKVREQVFQVLMAMTETEAAALAMLDVIERAREALRAALKEGDST